MLNKELTKRIEVELSGLYSKRPALEKERFRVLYAVDCAEFITPDLREEIHSYYNRKLARLQTDIADMRANLQRIKGGGTDA